MAIVVRKSPGRTLPCAFLLLAAVMASGCASTREQRGAYLEVIRADQRPPLVGVRAAADSLFGPAEESERGDGIAESRRAGLQALVERFAPTLVLPSGDNIGVHGRKIQLLPIHPRCFADTLRVDRVRAAPYQLQDFQDIPFAGLDPDSLSHLIDMGLRSQSDPELLEVWYFDFPGTKPREWWEAYARLRSGPDSTAWSRPTVFAHPFLDERGRVVVQYWYFYPMNDYIADHEGDWEHINVVLGSDRSSIEEVHYFFHARSASLPQGNHRPEVVDRTHPVVYVGGRAYMVLDYPIRHFAHDRNSGSHGNYPYPGEWEAVAGLGHTESVSGPGKDSSRTVPYARFQVVLTPEPSRIDYRRDPEVLREWAWLLMPARWGFPSAPSMGSQMMAADVGNRAPFGPAFNAGWNRAGPGLTYPGYRIRKIPVVRSALEDLLQPWYYLYAFRHPRYVHDTRGTLRRKDLERLGFVPRGGWAERGVGTTILGLSLGYPRGDFAGPYGSSTGISLWHNLWAKARFGAIEFTGGYQRFPRTEGVGGSLFVYPITANLVVRAPEALLRPYAVAGAGPSGWESRIRVPNSSAQLITSGWGLGWTAGVGVEYYLRPRVAFDVAVRYQDTPGPGDAGMGGRRLHFMTLWAGHYVRF
jgi:opacity protein-like surface antigen